MFSPFCWDTMFCS